MAIPAPFRKRRREIGQRVEMDGFCGLGGGFMGQFRSCAFSPEFKVDIDSTAARGSG